MFTIARTAIDIVLAVFSEVAKKLFLLAAGMSFVTIGIILTIVLIVTR